MGLFGSSVVGYNKEKIEAVRDDINITCEKVGNKIVEVLHDKIIVPISTCWYAPEAVEFFNSFAEEVKKTAVPVRESFDNFRASIQEAGKEWALNASGKDMKAPEPILASISQIEMVLSTQEILEKDGSGNVTIDQSQANSIANSLSQVEQDLKSELRKLAAELKADTAFIGGNQADAIDECFVTVTGNVSKIFAFLTTDTSGGASLKSCIEAASKKYGDVSAHITSEYNKGAAAE